MFDRIAGVYDRMNAVMTAGMHHQWRRRAADLAALAPGDAALDVATGTGDLAFELARRVAPGGSVIGADFSEGMLDLARAKIGTPARTARARASDGLESISSRAPLARMNSRAWNVSWDRLAITTRSIVAPRSSRIVLNRSWLSGRSGDTPWRRMAIALASHGPIQIGR